ncbi:hypothetical protein [Parasitella parasitica]|uniref:Uncharacterized protein n=1 Tax=Parasitella parasitica TaxID=35722 RepID=A0A0B7N761_9FUNG|nr:hypothetical protein [Parasitella parasitica]
MIYTDGVGVSVLKSRRLQQTLAAQVADKEEIRYIQHDLEENELDAINSSADNPGAFRKDIMTEQVRLAERTFISSLTLDINKFTLFIQRRQVAEPVLKAHYAEYHTNYDVNSYPLHRKFKLYAVKSIESRSRLYKKTESKIS